jgi:hypothetical protein
MNAVHAGLGLFSSVSRSLAGASILLAWDVGNSGSFLLSLMVCPFWLLGSVLNNLAQRPGWSVALVRIAIPGLTLGMALGINELQLRMAYANADRIINACNRFHADRGMYPSKLDELVPDYLASVPRAKYCLAWGEFVYFDWGDKHMLMWYYIPPYGRENYFLERGEWHFLD